MSSVEALGHGSAAYLIAQAQQQQHTASAQSVLSAAALASAAGVHAKNSSRYLGQASIVEYACKCLLKAPLLSELHEWTNWQLLFEAELGSLSDFVEQKGMCCAALCCAALRSAMSCCFMPDQAVQPDRIMPLSVGYTCQYFCPHAHISCQCHATAGSNCCMLTV